MKKDKTDRSVIMSTDEASELASVMTELSLPDNPLSMALGKAVQLVKETSATGARVSIWIREDEDHDVVNT